MLRVCTAHIYHSHALLAHCGHVCTEAAGSGAVQHCDSIGLVENIALKKTLDLVWAATATMHGRVMRIAAADAASNKADFLHPAYEVLICCAVYSLH
jgi:hypothetical protein